MTQSPENVILLVIDSLRYDRLSCYGYKEETTPFLDSLAKRGTKFETAIAPAPWTVPVHGSLFTGDLPSYHGSHRKSKRFKRRPEESLAGILSAQGYQTAGFSANPWISPEFNFDTGFDEFDGLDPQPPFPEEPTAPTNEAADLSSPRGIFNVAKWVLTKNPIKRTVNGSWKRFLDSEYAPGSQVTAAITDWARSGPDEKQFIFANYMDVHDPYYEKFFGEYADEPLHEQRGLQRLSLLKKVGFMSEPDDPERARELYDESVRRVDEYVELLFDRLADTLDLNESLVLVLGDHGECLGEHEYWGHGTYLHDELLRVPLIVDFPDSMELTLDPTTPVSLCDLYDFITTLANGSETDVAKTSESLSRSGPLFAECTGPRPNMQGIASSEGYRATIDKGWKLVRDRSNEQMELFEILYANDQKLPSTEAKSHLEEHEHERWSGQSLQVNDEDDSMSTETKRRLSDLGYL